MKVFAKTALVAAVVAGQAFFAPTASAQTNNFPEKSLTYIVPFPPGGPTDVAGRVLADALGKELKQTVVVENKSGASGSIGINQMIRSEPDGYTIAALGAPSLTAPFMLPQPPYDLKTDVKPVGVAYITPLVIVVNPKVTPDIIDMASLVKVVKEKKEGLNYTTAGIGSTAHLAMELIRKDLGLNMTHIPFRGSAPGVTALLAGDVELMYSDLVAVLPQITAGNLRPIAVNTSTRLDELPNTPTLEEQNIQVAKAASWAGLLAPKDTPDDRVNILSAALKKVLDDKTVQTRLKAVGAYPSYTSPEEMQKIIERDSAIWAGVIEENNLKQTN